MSKDELWQLYVKQNPDFETTGANFTAKGVRKMFDLTWDRAYEKGKTVGAAMEANRKPPFENITGNPFKDIFGL